MSTRRLVGTVVAVVVALGACASAAAVATPARTVVEAAPVTSLSLTRTSVAYAVGRSRRDCYHVELWSTRSRGTWRFGRPGPCRGDEPSTGRGISSVAVASQRVVWVSYAGGNIRDWMLYTATPTRRTPRLLRFVSRDVDGPPPIAIGDGAAEGVPYAVDAAVTYLGENGAAIFRATLDSPVRQLAAGTGPRGVVVAALLADGRVVLLSRTGAVVEDLDFAPGDVKAIRLAPAGLVLQRAGAIEIHDGTRTTSRPFPLGQMLDYANGRVLYRLGREIRTLRIATGSDALLLPPYLRGTPLASLDPRGLAWARGSRVSWACGGCIRFGSS